MNPYIGHDSQIWSVEEHRLVGGKGDGMRLLEISSGTGVHLTVSLDRAADISRLRFRGINMGYFSPCGYVGPAYIIAVHNHPSGFCEPSKEDIRITKRLVSAGKVLGIPLLDHIIFGKNQEYSFAENMPSVFRGRQPDHGVGREAEELPVSCEEAMYLEERAADKTFHRARKPVKTRLP